MCNGFSYFVFYIEIFEEHVSSMLLWEGKKREREGINFSGELGKSNVWRKSFGGILEWKKRERIGKEKRRIPHFGTTLIGSADKVEERR
mmetsp:Transcript_162/g.243  ORF Transcript_162/g.243 Transcript_162/m.243 type:complete len:89 (+) Transcript_162:93-359(+)